MKNFMKILFSTAFLLILACGADMNDPYTGYDDYVDKSDGDYQDRPDSGNIPGGGSSDEDNVVPVVDNDQEMVEDKDLEVTDTDELEEGVYSQEPTVDSCESGSVSDSEKTKVLVWVNYIRSLHDLSPVAYEEDDDIYTAECSLVIAANKRLEHFPDSSWDCFTEDALTGCSKSNIYIYSGGNPLSVPSESIINAYMTDIGVEVLGHRRWLIDPWLAHVSFSRVDDVHNKVLGSAIKVINDEQQDISGSDIEFVAYPYEYYPKELFNSDVQMSFTVVEDTTSKWQNDDVDFLTAAIAVTDPDNKKMTVSGRASDNEGYGVPNILRWKVDSAQEGVKYNVVISNVRVNNVPKTYSYWFELK